MQNFEKIFGAVAHFQYYLGLRMKERISFRDFVSHVMLHIACQKLPINCLAIADFEVGGSKVLIKLKVVSLRAFHIFLKYDKIKNVPKFEGYLQDHFISVNAPHNTPPHNIHVYHSFCRLFKCFVISKIFDFQHVDFFTYFPLLFPESGNTNTCV